MGSLRHLHLEFPLAFVQALNQAPANTEVALLNACCKDDGTSAFNVLEETCGYLNLLLLLFLSPMHLDQLVVR